MSMSTATSPLTTVAGYLLTRLTEAGVISVFGVPGDYNLGILDAIENRKSMAWVGTAAAELGTLLAQGLALVMIVISKGGYATERLIGPDDAPPLLRDLTRETGADGHSLSNDYSLR
jgi:TPP-dependent 2-oxoacid decarboxylase